MIAKKGLEISTGINELRWSDMLLPSGTLVEVQYGPVCDGGNSLVWQVRTSDGLTGFVMENDSDEYYLSPDVDLSMATGSFSCAGALPPRLRVGMHARVTVTNGIPLRVRSDPSYSQKVRQQIPEATEFDVIDGPVCAEQTVWWKIQSGDGLKGWVAEGQDGEYYVEPW